jgi:hypothetical protein
MLLDIPDTLQISTHVLTGRVAGLSGKSNMDICSNPTGSGVNHVAINLTLFLCAYYNAYMLLTYPNTTCWLNIVSTLADTVFGHVADMSADMLATCRADTHASVDSTIFSTFKNPTFPAKRISLACCIPFNIFFVGRAAAGGGQLLLGEIQLATDVVMLPSFPQQTTRWSSLGI